METLIFKKILDIQEELPAILKSREFKNQGRTVYKFRGIDDLYNTINPLFKKHRVFMTPEILEHDSSEKPTKSGTMLFYEKMVIRYTLYAEDGSSVSASVKGIGMDSADKAGNKALSVGQKYALIQIFSIPTDDPKDPEMDAHDVSSSDIDLGEIQTKLDNCHSIEEMRTLKDMYGPSADLQEVRSLFVKRYNQLK